MLGILALMTAPLVLAPAQADPPQATLGMYLDQPFVQGSYVAEDYPSDTTTTTFNNQNFGDVCSFNGGTVQPLYGSTPDCHVQTNVHFGGASTTSSTPVAGQSANPINYGQVGNGGASIVFDNPQTYFGLWWSAGSIGNEIRLYNGSNLVANTSANDVASTLFSAGYISAQSGDQYSTRFYIGNPVDWYSVGSPYDFSDQDPNNTYQSYFSLAQEPFVYIHFIAAAGVTFDRVDLIAPGNGFEFDNFTISSATSIRSAGIPTRLVLQRELYEPNYVDFDANGGSGTLPRQYSVDNQPGYLQSSCLNYYDPTRCIGSPNNSYATQLMGWNTTSDGTGDFYDLGSLYPFSSNRTLYAQWQTQFNFVNLTNSVFDASNVWDYVDWDSQTSSSLPNFADVTLPSRSRPGQYLEGWYTFDPTYTSVVRIGSPGDVVSASSYTLWDPTIFGRWLDNPPPPAVDALTPDVLLVYPRATSVTLPKMPLTGDTSAEICLVESDNLGNPVSSNLQFTDLGTAISGFSSSFSISDTSPLVTTTSRFIKVTVSPSGDSACVSGQSHIIEVRLLGAVLTQINPLYLTVH